MNFNASFARPDKRLANHTGPGGFRRKGQAKKEEAAVAGGFCFQRD